LKESQQKKATTILVTVIGGGTVLGLLIFIVAYAKGVFSSAPPEPNKVVAELTARDSAAKATGEKKPVETKPQQAQWPANWNKVSIQEITVGDATVLVLKPRRGPPPKELKTTDKEVLIVPVNLQLKQGAGKKIPLTSWADDKQKKSVFLQDDPREGRGNNFALLGVVPRAGDDPTQVSDKRIQLHLVFEMPAPIPKSMYLVLPGAALGAPGATIAYQFDANDVEGAK
jgi:hypothetical protein